MGQKLADVISLRDQPTTFINLEGNLTKTKADNLLGLFVSKNRTHGSAQKAVNQSRLKKIKFFVKQMTKEKTIKTAFSRDFYNRFENQLKSTTEKYFLFILNFL